LQVKNAEQSEQSDWTILQSGDLTEFVGYEHMEVSVQIMKYRKVEKKGKTAYHLVFDQTPFYAESGGQVGDAGYLQYGDEKISILDTTKENHLSIHLVNKLPINPMASFKAVVNKSKRVATEMNHSATHLLHEALREVLGTHVEQRGSLVNENYLRFDFSHFERVNEEQLAKIEALVNQGIEANLSLEAFTDTPIAAAKAMGAMALFGEKYGDKVRVIKFGTSVELCGGTHVAETGKIKQFKISSESSSAAGIRRIEAWTGAKVLAYYKEQEVLLNSIKEVLKQAPKPLETIEKMQAENADLKKKLEQFSKMQEAIVKLELKSIVATKNGVNSIIAIVDLASADAIKNVAFQLKNEIQNLFLVLGAALEGKPLLTVMISDELTKTHDLHAGNIIRNLAKEIQGGGGGQAFFATAGGKDVAGLKNAINKAKELI
jgi:alanyl-tRNA synthetase